MRPFGGYSIIFSEGLCQLKGRAKHKLLYSSDSNNLWNESVKTVIILDSNHCFNKDQYWGNNMKTMWEKGLPKSCRLYLNKNRFVGQNGLKLSSPLPDNCTYESIVNREHNAISAANFKRHILVTHPTIDSGELPLYHAIVVQAEILSSESENKDIPVDNILQKQFGQLVVMTQ